jgi:recombination protein RecA
MASASTLEALALLPNVTTAAELGRAKREPLPIDLPLAALLPDGGLPRGAVIEVAAPDGLGRATSLVLAACVAAQREGRLCRGQSAWCAFVDPDRTLYAPAVRAAGIDLHRLLVVRPLRSQAARVALQLAQSGVFSVIVIDVSGVPGAHVSGILAPSAEPLLPWSKLARRLSLAVETTESSVILLTDANAPRAAVLPVALRVELEREQGELVSVRIAKDKHGRVGGPRRIAWTRPCAESSSRTGSG